MHNMHEHKQILTISQAKFDKSKGQGYIVAGLQLAPSTTSGRANLCPCASDGCATACIAFCGKNRFEESFQARQWRTDLYLDDPTRFKQRVSAEISHLQGRAWKQGKLLAIRLNTLSDIPWERVWPQVFEAFPFTQFYDYTKIIGRMGKTPSNYHLTFSRAEDNDDRVQRALEGLHNVAVVFRGKLPETWRGRPVIDGDADDLRFLDPIGCVVGLKAKGPAVKDFGSGFVVDVQEVAFSV